MPRPKTILWVDDEIEGLAAHRRFLEGQGFSVEQAAHGDDALALLRRRPYSVVLLDEQMPGLRGLELLAEIRAIDPAMPVVMVTQSEDDATLREAIGFEVADYLVKPVHPRQLLSVVTRPRVVPIEDRSPIKPRWVSSIRQMSVRGAERAPARRLRAKALRRPEHQAEVLPARSRPERLPSAIPSDCTLAHSQIRGGFLPQSLCREAMPDTARPLKARRRNSQ